MNGTDDALIKIDKVITRRDIHGVVDERLLVLYQTSINGGATFRNNGVLIGDQYGRPDKLGEWPDWVPSAVRQWMLCQLGPVPYGG